MKPKNQAFLPFKDECSIGSIHFRQYISHICEASHPKLFDVVSCVYVSRIIWGVRVWKWDEPTEVGEEALVPSPADQSGSLFIAISFLRWYNKTGLGNIIAELALLNSRGNSNGHSGRNRLLFRVQ